MQNKNYFIFIVERNGKYFESNENYSESIEKYFESNEREYWQHVILISYPTLIEVILNSY